MLAALEQLTRLPDEELAKKGLADLSFTFAEGLPGVGSIPITQYDDLLDGFARLAKREMKRHYPLFEANRERFDNSKARYRVMALITVLQRDLWFRYDQSLIDRDDFFADATNVFLHGVIQRRKGTCSNLPILVVAVGRRLGFPLKLASTKYHLYARWDGDGDCFNIECTSLGLINYQDNHYLSWPASTTDKEAVDHDFLKSKTPTQELAFLFVCRGHVLLDNRLFAEAAECYACAYQLQPTCGLHRQSYLATVDRWRRWLRLRWGWNRPFPRIRLACRQRAWPALPPREEADLFYLSYLSEWLERQPSMRPESLIIEDYYAMLNELQALLRSQSA